MVDAELLAQCATWMGQHALALFFTMLALTLAATCAGWWLVRRYNGPAFRISQVPARFCSLRVAVGSAVMVIAIAVFAALASALGAGDALGRADQTLTDALRSSVPTAVVQVFAALTHLGDTATLTGLCIGIATVLVAAAQRWLAVGWVVAVAGNGVLNHTLKQIFDRIRPLGLDGQATAEGYSFPSGHSSGSVVAFGMLAYLALRLLPLRWHLPALILAVTLAFSVGNSRLFLRVHFASDVIAGFATGTAWLALCVTMIELVRCYQRRDRKRRPLTSGPGAQHQHRVGSTESERV